MYNIIEDIICLCCFSNDLFHDDCYSLNYIYIGVSVLQIMCNSKDVCMGLIVIIVLKCVEGVH